MQGPLLVVPEYPTRAPKYVKVPSSIIIGRSLRRGTLMTCKVLYVRSLNILRGPLKMLGYLEQLLLQGPLGEGTLMTCEVPYLRSLNILRGPFNM